MRTVIGTPGLKAGAKVPSGLLYRWFGAQGITIPQQVIVPDISFYQSTADFTQMKAQGARGVIIRAGQNVWPDPKFATFWRDAKAAGLPRGTYWYYDSRVSPRVQADLFYSQFADDLPEMEIVADYEESYGGQYSGWRNFKDFLERMVAYGVPYSKLAIYSGYYYWRANSPQSDPLELSYFQQFRPWLAWYTTNPEYVTIPAPWTNEDLLFWQFTSSGNGLAYGVGSLEIDLNYFNGTADQFDAKYSVTTPPPDPPTGDTMKATFTNGATLETWSEFGHDIHVLTVPADAIELASFYYTPGQGHKAEDLVNNPYKIFFNFSPYDFGTHRVDEFGLRIDGVEYQGYDTKSYGPWLMWNSALPVIKHKYGDWKYVSTGAQSWRYVFENGAKNPNANAEWSLPYAQRIIANDGEGNTIIISTSGEPGGPTLNQMAEILKGWVSNGHGKTPINYAIHGDSGHSVATSYFKDGQKETFIGPRDGTRNTPPCFGYLRLKTPLLTESDPGPDPEPDPDPDPVTPDLPVEITLGDDETYERQVISVVVKAKQ